MAALHGDQVIGRQDLGWGVGGWVTAKRAISKCGNSISGTLTPYHV